MSGAFSTLGGDDKCIQKIFMGTPEVLRSLEGRMYR